MDSLKMDSVHHVVCHECKPLHNTLVKEFLSKLDEPETRKTHYFNGRYENIYIDQDAIPSIKPILHNILCEAAKILNRAPEQLQIGFWFNLMQKGDVTLPHTHDDDDELVSGTYYIQMPKDSGHLKINTEDQVIDIDPVESTLTLFPPTLEHEVTTHESAQPRISIGFNIGVKSDEHSD